MLPDVFFWTSCICRTTLLPRFCKDAQSPWVGSLCAGAQHSPPHGLNAAAGLLEHSAVDNRYWEHTTGGEAGNDDDSASECSSGSLLDAEEASR